VILVQLLLEERGVSID